MRWLYCTVAASLLAACGGESEESKKTSNFGRYDRNSDGLVSYEEAKLAWYLLDLGAFIAADADADGSLNPEELDTMISRNPGGF